MVRADLRSEVDAAGRLTISDAYPSTGPPGSAEEQVTVIDLTPLTGTRSWPSTN